MEGMRNTHKILVGKHDGMRPCRRPRCRQKDNIRIDLREIGWDGVDWIQLAQEEDWQWALVNMVLNIWAS
jgi:hypothetical protein